MKTIRKYIGLALIGLGVCACGGGEDDFREEGKEDSSIEYQVVTIEHANKSFGYLELTGSKLSGSIQWGDNESEMFAGRNTPPHTYQTAEQRIVTIKVQQADGITLPTVEGVSRIDLSGF